MRVTPDPACSSALLEGRPIDSQLRRRAPDFLIISPPRTGSSWLAASLRACGVYIPPGKELHYFNSFGYRFDVNWYLRHFPDDPHRIKGEATPYANLPGHVIARIAGYFPDVRLVFVLRDPVDRAWSELRHRLDTGHGPFRAVGEGGEVTDELLIEEACSLDSIGTADYASCLRRWLEHFDRGQLHVAFYDDLARDPRRFLEGVLRHVGADSRAIANADPAGRRVNQSRRRRMSAHVRDALVALHAGRAAEVRACLLNDLGISCPEEWGRARWTAGGTQARVTLGSLEITLTEGSVAEEGRPDFIARSHEELLALRAGTFDGCDRENFWARMFDASLARTFGSEFIELEQLHGHMLVLHGRSFYAVPLENWHSCGTDAARRATLQAEPHLSSWSLDELRQQLTPVVVEAVRGHNIVRYKRRFYVAAHASGPLDMAAMDDVSLARAAREQRMYVAASLGDAVAAATTEKTTMTLTGRDFGGSLKLPDIIEIEPTDTCNLRCRACHVSFMQQERPRMLDFALIEKLKPLGARYAIVGSVFEPTVHPRFNDIIQSLSDQGCRIELLTNGTMFDAAGVRALAAANMYYISFSFDGIRRETFEHIRRRARYDDVIDRILAVRSAFEGRETFFNLNYTIMRRNLDELADATDFWDRHGFDAMNFIFMVLRELDPELIRESLYPVRQDAYRRLDDLAVHVIETGKRITLRAPYYRRSPLRRLYARHFDDVVVHSDHPQARIVPIPRNDMQLRPFPGMRHPCGSPFTLARVLANGDVQLCYQFVVGNLHERSFVDIWYGEEADRVRRQLMADPCTCRACDYYRFALKYNEMDLEDPSIYFSANTVGYAQTVDFEKGVVLVPRPPRLVESIGKYNVVYYDRKYFGIPQAAGPLRVDADDVVSIPGVIVDASLAQVRTGIRRVQPEPAADTPAAESGATT